MSVFDHFPKHMLPPLALQRTPPPLLALKSTPESLRSVCMRRLHMLRLRATGASEYNLNSKVVTYTAYNAALITHNILVKAKNFLVFQGDVEAVASQSPRELSRLIEQISGSLELAAEYDKANEAQERAKENATFNFTKRRGIAGEIKQTGVHTGSLTPLHISSAFSDQLILDRLLTKLYHIDLGIEDNTRAIVKKNKELAGLRQEQKEHDKELDATRGDQAEARTAIMQKEKNIKKVDKALEAKKPELIATKAQITHATRKMNNAEKSKDELVKNKKQLEVKLVTVRKAAQKAQEEQRKASQHNVALSEDSEEYHNLKASSIVLAVYERQSLESLTREEKTAARALAQLSEKEQGFEEKKVQPSEELGSLNEKSQELEEKIDSLQTELAHLLQAGVDRHESEKEAKFKETLASLQRLFPGVRGRIIDLCKPSARKYTTAISVILGRNTDAIVVDDEKTAIDCIEYMRTQRAGQATFIPLDTIQVKPVNDKLRSFTKGASYEPAVERAIHHACANALVCDTMEIARFVCYEKGQEVKGVVTLEGTIIHKSGLITGGRSTHNSDKKWDEKDVQGLIRVRDTLLAEQRELSKQKPRGKTDEALVNDITRLEANFTVVKGDLRACKLRLTGIKDELKHFDKELETVSPELKKVTFSNLVQPLCRLRFDTQIARLTNQYVPCAFLPLKLHSRMKASQATEHLEHLEVLINNEKATLRSSRSNEWRLRGLSLWQNDEIEKLVLEQSALYRKCRLEEIKLPLLEGDLKNVPMEENLREEMAMDVDEDENETQRPKVAADYGIQDPAETLSRLDKEIGDKAAEIERMAPNMKAMERLDDVETKLEETEREAEKARKDSKAAPYSHISEHIDNVYKELTKGKALPMGGVTYLSLGDSEEPYNAGIKYHAMLCDIIFELKRFAGVAKLSSGLRKSGIPGVIICH
ncbi:hypothetical protein CPB84DRAFT_1816222 [Gymnopilus junonius]|uniref:SMC hinge domain-containing protein n=1 Tax=Gymnopilus junonius TaxID=109634 RepID=A0A9P5NJM7_GYMJU|nr:hypothetical protein CPB84DRAFT_1816222 [Gymnopilus junonius]